MEASSFGHCGVGEAGLKEAEVKCQDHDDHRGEVVHAGPDLLPQDGDQQLPQGDEPDPPGGGSDWGQPVGSFCWEDPG